MGERERALDATIPSLAPGAAPAAGEIVGGKYRVERLLGAGGMAVVLEATHLELDQRVALKLLNHEALQSADLVARFHDEARATAKLKSEHVAKVHDVGTRPDGSSYIVMECLEGNDLAAELAKNGALPTLDAVEYVIQACEALSEAHYRGIVHRDVKPENLFLVSRPGGRFVKVLDFGISKSALTGQSSSVDLEETGTQRVMGSPYYMSPEQLRSARSVDGRTDIWSLGAVLFELLAGVRAFPDADDFSSLVITIVQDRHRSLLDYLPSVDLRLLEVVDRCLEKDREKRYETAAELAMALLPFARPRARATAERAVAFAESTGTARRLPVPRPSGPLVPRDLNATSAGLVVLDRRPSPPRAAARRPMWPLVVAAGGAALLGAVGARLLSASHPASAPAAPTSAAASAEAAPAPPQETARITISATPADARIVVDGADAPTNPFTATFRRDGLTHFVRVDATGYEPKTRTFAASGDSTLEVALVVAHPAAPPTSAKRAPPPVVAPRPPRPLPPPPPVAAAAPSAPASLPAGTPSAPASARPKGPAIDGTNPYGN